MAGTPGDARAPRIRPARAADAERLAGLTTQLGYPTTPPQAAQRLAGITAAARSNALLVAVDKADDVIGWAHVALRPSLEHDAAAQLAGLVVDDAVRSGGVGAALLAASEAWAAEHGAGVMLVSSRATRMRAHRFYDRHGYGLWKDSVWLRKPLA
jgi:GNAT superfamily N-acetyltransferase